MIDDGHSELVQFADTIIAGSVSSIIGLFGTVATIIAIIIKIVSTQN